MRGRCGRGVVLRVCDAERGRGSGCGAVRRGVLGGGVFGPAEVSDGTGGVRADGCAISCGVVG